MRLSLWTTIVCRKMCSPFIALWIFFRIFLFYSIGLLLLNPFKTMLEIAKIEKKKLWNILKTNSHRSTGQLEKPSFRNDFIIHAYINVAGLVHILIDTHCRSYTQIHPAKASCQKRFKIGLVCKCHFFAAQNHCRNFYLKRTYGIIEVRCRRPSRTPQRCF